MPGKTTFQWARKWLSSYRPRRDMALVMPRPTNEQRHKQYSTYRRVAESGYKIKRNTRTWRSKARIRPALRRPFRDRDQGFGRCRPETCRRRGQRLQYGPGQTRLRAACAPACNKSRKPRRLDDGGSALDENADLRSDRLRSPALQFMLAEGQPALHGAADAAAPSNTRRETGWT